MAATTDGLTLTQPKALLEAWREEYAPLAVSKKRLYTPLHGRELEDALQVVMSVANASGAALLSSFSAAAWIAPYARTSRLFLYADELALQSLTTSLSLVSSAKGENVVVTVIEDLGVLNDCIVEGDGMLCTSPVQTYLDLWIAGERGREAAEHLRRERLQWSI